MKFLIEFPNSIVELNRWSHSSERLISLDNKKKFSTTALEEHPKSRQRITVSVML